MLGRLVVARMHLDLLIGRALLLLNFNFLLRKMSLPSKTCYNYCVSPIITSEEIMKLVKKQIKIERPAREKVSREQALKRVKELPKRKEKIIAAIREDTH